MSRALLEVVPPTMAFGIGMDVEDARADLRLLEVEV